MTSLNKLQGAVKCYEEPVTIYRERTGFYVKGRYQESPPETIGAEVAIQNINGRERLLLPEGTRSQGAIKIFSRVLLKTGNVANKVRADRIKWRDCLYEVIEVKDWMTEGGYYWALAVKVGQ